MKGQNYKNARIEALESADKTEHTECVKSYYCNGLFNFLTALLH
jgi:hypothetical protein